MDGDFGPHRPLAAAQRTRRHAAEDRSGTKLGFALNSGQANAVKTKPGLGGNPRGRRRMRKQTASGSGNVKVGGFFVSPRLRSH